MYDPQFQRIEEHIRQLLAANSSLATGENVVPNTSVLGPQIEASSQGNFGTQNGHKSPQKSLAFQPNWRHEEALKFMQKRPDVRTQCEAMIRTDPRNGFEHIAEHIRQQPGMNHTFITAQFVAEVWSLLQFAGEANGKTNGRHVTVNDDAERVGNNSTKMPPLFDSNSGAHFAGNVSGNTDEISITPTTPRTSRITQKLDPISATDRGRISAAFEARIGTNTESPTRMNQPYTITIEEAARHFQCSESVIVNALKRGKLQAPKKGSGKVLVSSLERFVPPRRTRVA